MTKGKKYMHYLPHVVVGIIMLMAASGKLLGNPMSVDLFNQLNLLGMAGASRVILGIVQVVLVAALFNKKTEKMAAVLIALNMVGAFILVAVHAQAVIILVLSLVIIAMNKKNCMDCKDGMCDMEKSCGDCKDGVCGEMCKEKGPEESMEMESEEPAQESHM